jgi:hypothetical protein
VHGFAITALALAATALSAAIAAHLSTRRLTAATADAPTVNDQPDRADQAATET